MGMLHSQGSPNHLNSPGTHGYHAIYANSSPSSSPISHPSTPGATTESPLVQAYSPTQAQAAAGSPGLLHEDASPPPMAITVKQEPQELDQMYLDDGEWRHFFFLNADKSLSSYTFLTFDVAIGYCIYLTSCPYL